MLYSVPYGLLFRDPTTLIQGKRKRTVFSDWLKTEEEVTRTGELSLREASSILSLGRSYRLPGVTVWEKHGFYHSTSTTRFCHQRTRIIAVGVVGEVLVMICVAHNHYFIIITIIVGNPYAGNWKLKKRSYKSDINDCSSITVSYLI